MDFIYFKPVLTAIFVTIATIKFKLMQDFYTWAIVLINQKEEIGEKQLLVFGIIGGQNRHLMHVDLYN